MLFCTHQTHFMKNRLWACVFVLMLSCGNKYTSFSKLYEFDHSSSVPHYNNLNYWAAHPWKQDPSDSIPAAIVNEIRDSVADVFFIHPTTYTRKRKDMNADINNADLNAKTDYTSILYQASVFNQHARVFAPRYRQAHLSAFFTKDSAAFETAYDDVRNAFLYYLQHFNNGRPIIIAGHSQGALMSIRLLKEFFDGKPLQQNLVAAYVIGWPVLKTEFTQLKPCSDSLMTGCIISWRTFKKDYEPAYVAKEKEAYVTNPLNWKTDTAYASKEMNKGSVFLKFNEIVLNTTDAQVNGNVLWVHRPKFPGSLFYRSRNYHIADINLFYMNIRKNIEQRMNAYLQKH